MHAQSKRHITAATEREAGRGICSLAAALDQQLKTRIPLVGNALAVLLIFFSCGNARLQAPASNRRLQPSISSQRVHAGQPHAALTAIHWHISVTTGSHQFFFSTW